METKQVLGDRVRGISHTIPPASYSPRSGTTSDLTYQFPKGYVPTPFIRHNVDPSVGDPQPLPAKLTEQAIAPPQIEESSAETPIVTGRLFLGFTPQPLWQQLTQDFYLPLDIPMALPMTYDTIPAVTITIIPVSNQIPDKSISTIAHPYSYIPNPNRPIPTWLIPNPNRPIPTWLIPISNNSILIPNSSIPSNTIILSYILSNPNIPTPNSSIPNCSIQTNSFNQTKSSIFHSYILLLYSLIYFFPPT